MHSKKSKQNLNVIIGSSVWIIVSMIYLFCLASVYSQTTKGDKSLIRLKAYNIFKPDLIDETVIYFDSIATMGFDPMLDAIKMMNTGPEIPNFYSIINNSKYCINGLPYSRDNEITIELGFEVMEKGTFQIEAKQMFNILENVMVELIDKEKEITQNLKTNPNYNFYFLPGTTKRFYIRFSKVSITTYSEKYKDLKGIEVSKIGNCLWVTNNLYNESSLINIYNLSGILQDLKKIKSYQNYNICLNPGIYIVEIISGSNRITKKYNFK